MIGWFGAGLAVPCRLTGISGSCATPTDHEYYNNHRHDQGANDQDRQKLVEITERTMRKHYHMNHGLAP